MFVLEFCLVLRSARGHCVPTLFFPPSEPEYTQGMKGLTDSQMCSKRRFQHMIGLFQILIWPDIRPITLPDTGPDIRLNSKYKILKKKKI